MEIFFADVERIKGHIAYIKYIMPFVLPVFIKFRILAQVVRRLVALLLEQSERPKLQRTKILGKSCLLSCSCIEHNSCGG
jgi:hypothetical protein